MRYKDNKKYPKKKLKFSQEFQPFLAKETYYNESHII